MKYSNIIFESYMDDFDESELEDVYYDDTSEDDFDIACSRASNDFTLYNNVVIFQFYADDYNLYYNKFGRDLFELMLDLNIFMKPKSQTSLDCYFPVEILSTNVTVYTDKHNERTTKDIRDTEPIDNVDMFVIGYKFYKFINIKFDNFIKIIRIFENNIQRLCKKHGINKYTYTFLSYKDNEDHNPANIETISIQLPTKYELARFYSYAVLKDYRDSDFDFYNTGVPVNYDFGDEYKEHLDKNNTRFIKQTSGTISEKDYSYDYNIELQFYPKSTDTVHDAGFVVININASESLKLCDIIISMSKYLMKQIPDVIFTYAMTFVFSIDNCDASDTRITLQQSYFEYICECIYVYTGQKTYRCFPFIYILDSNYNFMFDCNDFILTNRNFRLIKEIASKELFKHTQNEINTWK